MPFAFIMCTLRSLSALSLVGVQLCAVALVEFELSFVMAGVLPAVAPLPEGVSPEFVNFLTAVDTPPVLNAEGIILVAQVFKARLRLGIDLIDVTLLH